MYQILFTINILKKEIYSKNYEKDLNHSMLKFYRLQVS